MIKGRATVVSATERVTFRDVGVQEGIEGEEHRVFPPLRLIPPEFFKYIYIEDSSEALGHVTVWHDSLWWS